MIDTAAIAAEAQRRLEEASANQFDAHMGHAYGTVHPSNRPELAAMHRCPTWMTHKSKHPLKLDSASWLRKGDEWGYHTYAEVLDAIARKPTMHDGPCFICDERSNVVGIDIDAHSEADYTGLQHRVIERLQTLTYGERSVSGVGWHFYGFLNDPEICVLIGNARKDILGFIHAFKNRCYLTVTGDSPRPRPIGDLTEFFREIVPWHNSMVDLGEIKAKRLKKDVADMTSVGIMHEVVSHEQLIAEARRLMNKSCQDTALLRIKLLPYRKLTMSRKARLFEHGAVKAFQELCARHVSIVGSGTKPDYSRIDFMFAQQVAYLTNNLDTFFDLYRLTPLYDQERIVEKKAKNYLETTFASALRNVQNAKEEAAKQREQTKAEFASTDSASFALSFDPTLRAL